MKLMTLAVPCYNSEEYMDKCLNTLLTGGEDVEIIIIDDGSTDRTGEIADSYAEKYPDIVRVIHQPNGGHGEGVNQGLRHATGLYYKVVDSDDWLGEKSLQRILVALKVFEKRGTLPDLLVANYVYEHVEDGTSYSVNYKNVFPVEKLFGWEDVGRFRQSQYLLMHSAIYRTDILRKSRMELPKHTFYVDNIFVFQPLPFVERLYYMDEDLYHYYIGREDQSVNEKVMIGRIDQQIRVTSMMRDFLARYTDPECAGDEACGTAPLPKRLHRYMLHYLSMMYTICTTLLLRDGSQDAMAKESAIWQDLATLYPRLDREIRSTALGRALSLPLPGRRRLIVAGYRLARRIVKFN